MLDALQTLLENNVISQELKEDVAKAWDKQLAESREQVAHQLREEFAQKYEHDKTAIVEAIDNLVSDQIREELGEFIHDRKQLAEMKVKYARHMNETAKNVKTFVTKQLAEEIKDLHADTRLMAENFKVLENFVVEALAQEIAEFYKDKQDLAETKVRMVREGKAKLKQIQEQFIKRASTMVESVVTESLTTELKTLKEDIDMARKADFGRKLFEAFANEYASSYLNEKSETSKLLKVIKDKDAAIAEAADAVVAAERLLESRKSEIQTLKESYSRKETLNSLLAPLSAEHKTVMFDLLENVRTTKLNESFEKYLPAVISGKSSTKKQHLVESKEITGNKSQTTNNATGSDASILEIRKLAGFKN